MRLPDELANSGTLVAALTIRLEIIRRSRDSSPIGLERSEPDRLSDRRATNANAFGQASRAGSGKKSLVHATAHRLHHFKVGPAKQEELTTIDARAAHRIYTHFGQPQDDRTTTPLATRHLIENLRGGEPSAKLHSINIGRSKARDLRKRQTFAAAAS